MTTQLVRSESKELDRMARRPLSQRLGESGKIGYAILWLLGVPLPLLIIVWLIWGR